MHLCKYCAIVGRFFLTVLICKDCILLCLGGKFYPWIAFVKRFPGSNIGLALPYKKYFSERNSGVVSRAYKTIRKQGPGTEGLVFVYNYTKCVFIQLLFGDQPTRSWTKILL